MPNMLRPATWLPYLSISVSWLAPNRHKSVSFLVCRSLAATDSIIGGNFWLKNWADINDKAGINTDVGKFLGVYFAFGIGSAALVVIQTLILWIFCSIEVGIPDGKTGSRIMQMQQRKLILYWYRLRGNCTSVWPLLFSDRLCHFSRLPLLDGFWTAFQGMSLGFYSTPRRSYDRDVSLCICPGCPLPFQWSWPKVAGFSLTPCKSFEPGIHACRFQLVLSWSCATSTHVYLKTCS